MSNSRELAFNNDSRLSIELYILIEVSLYIPNRIMILNRTTIIVRLVTGHEYNLESHSREEEMCLAWKSDREIKFSQWRAVDSIPQI